MPNIHRTRPAAKMMLYADSELIERIRRYAAATETSCNRVIAKAVEQFLERA